MSSRKKQTVKNYIKLVLAMLPGVIAMIEFTIFWWNNNGLHTSRYDFFMKYPIHSIITIAIMFVSLIALSLIKESK